MEVQSNVNGTSGSEDDNEALEDGSSNERVMESFQPMAKRHRPLLLCGHCDKYLTKSTYYRHKEIYFNPVSLQWRHRLMEIEVDRAVRPSHLSTSQTAEMSCSSSPLDSTHNEGK